MSKCPCCGGAIAPHDIKVSLDRNEIAVGWMEGVVRLRPQHAEIAYLLVDAYPAMVRTDKLIAKLWGVTEPDWSIKSLHVHIHQLRKAIAPLGLQIVNTNSQGYFMSRVLIKDIAARIKRAAAA